MHFITRLTPNVTMTRACLVVQGAIIAWGIGTVVGLGVQCPSPTPWNTTDLATCSTARQGPLLYSVAIIDLVTDLIITAFPIIMMWNVQIPRGQRLTVMAVFIIRSLYVTSFPAQTSNLNYLLTTHSVPLAELPRLVYISRYLASTDPTFSSVNLSIWTQVVTNLSLATACIPCLKPFLTALGSGVLDTRLPTGFESRVEYTLNSGSGSGGRTNNGTNNTSGNHGRSGNRSQLNFYGGGKTSVIRTNIESQTGNGPSGGIQRSESKTRLTHDKGDEHIYRTTEFVMDVDDSPPGSGKKM